MSFPSDIAFTSTVKAVQARRGSRAAYARMEEKRGWPTEISDDLAHFLSAVQSFYLGTTNGEGQPYIQHRGGPPGFIRLLDKRTLAFADFRGNRQYITRGNLKDNPRAFMFVMDYETGQRVKIWGTASVVDWSREWEDRLAPKGYDAKPEQAILFTVAAWDRNCHQHIPRKIPAEKMESLVAHYQERVAALETEIASLRAANGVR
jgi:predicted pyridoxine 5'-phosphate oxidase superfamily flavin-nucleotide-binding protein